MYTGQEIRHNINGWWPISSIYSSTSNENCINVRNIIMINACIIYECVQQSGCPLYYIKLKY